MDLDSVSMPKRNVLALQLAPMIDIFFLIIIFLLKSTIVADVSVIFPSQMHPPLSQSRENLDTFPEVVLNETEVTLGFLNVTKKLEEIDTLTDEDIGILKAKVDSYIKSKDEKIRKQSININFITSRENNYKNIL